MYRNQVAVALSVAPSNRNSSFSSHRDLFPQTIFLSPTVYKSYHAGNHHRLYKLFLKFVSKYLQILTCVQNIFTQGFQLLFVGFL